MWRGEKYYPFRDLNSENWWKDAPHNINEVHRTSGIIPAVFS
jgi:hypothetical protein